MWCKNYLLFALPSEISSPELTSLDNQWNVAHFVMLQWRRLWKTWFVAGMHRITMVGWDLNHTLLVQPSPALHYREPNCCIVSGLHLSLHEEVLISEFTDISASVHQQVITSLPALPWVLICSEPVDLVLSGKRCWAPTDPFNFLGFKDFCHH